MNPIPKVELRLNEENELSFKMSIEGTTSDPKSKPKFRFLVTDFGSDKGIVYPCTKEPNDVIKVLIPGLKENYNIGKKYLGKLEVIMGSLYFTPTELLISFKEPLKIKAAPVAVTATVAKNKSIPSEPIDSDEELEDEEYDEDEDVEEEESDEEDTEEDDINDDDDSEEDMEDEDIEEEDDATEEEEELMEKKKPEYREEYHQLTSEAADEQINLDEFFISDPVMKTQPEKTVLPPEAIEGFTQIAFAPPASKPGTVLLAPGFEGAVPERVQKTFTASGLPVTSPEPKEVIVNSFQESKLSKAATAAKNNLKKAFLEALTHKEEQQQKSVPVTQPIKESVTKNKDTLEEAKRLLMSAAEENRKKKITVNAKVSNVSVAKPRSLKDLFSKDFLE